MSNDSKWLIGSSTSTPTNITFNMQGTEVFRITADGALVKGERMSDDDCTNALFEAISQGMVKKISDLRARAERLDRELEVLSQSHKAIAHQLADEHRRAEKAEGKIYEAIGLALKYRRKATLAERQRDEAFTAGAEAMREAIYNYVYDEAEAMKEQAYNLIEHHNFRPGGRGVSNEAKRKGFIRDRQQIAEKLFIDAAHIRTLPIPAQEGK